MCLHLFIFLWVVLLMPCDVMSYICTVVQRRKLCHIDTDEALARSYDTPKYYNTKTHTHTTQRRRSEYNSMLCYNAIMLCPIRDTFVRLYHPLERPSPIDTRDPHRYRNTSHDHRLSTPPKKQYDIPPV